MHKFLPESEDDESGPDLFDWAFITQIVIFKEPPIIMTINKQYKPQQWVSKKVEMYMCDSIQNQTTP